MENPEVINILLIEDNPGDAIIFRELLDEKKGTIFKLFIEERLDAGLKRLDLKDENFNIAVIDLNLPDSSGIETFRTLYKSASDLPIVVLTGAFYEEATGIQTVKEGAQDYLTKDNLNSTILYRSIRYAIEHKRLEETLSYLATFAELNPAPIIEVSLDGNIKYINPAAKQILPEIETEGKAHPWLNGLESIIGQFQSGEVTLTRILEMGDNWYHQVFHYLDKRGCIRVYGRNITELKQAEKVQRLAKIAAEDANNAKSRFIRNMSHDLRTPLNSILGYSRLLLETGGLTEKQRDTIKTIYYSGDILLHMIDNLLDMSKIEAGKSVLEYKPFQFQDFLNNLIEVFKIQLKDKNIDFIMKFSDNLPVTAICDETKLRQVLFNLLSNAVKFTEKGSITFGIQVLEKITRFEIEDTGIGIPSDKLDLIFEPFIQLSGASTSKGSGLGLTISREFIRMMGGELIVRSRYGEGTKFWFDLTLDSISQEKGGKKDEIYEQEIKTDDIIPPPQAELNELYGLAATGDIMNIRKWIEKNSIENNDISAFSKKLGRLAKNIRLKEISEFLKKYISAG